MLAVFPSSSGMIVHRFYRPCFSWLFKKIMSLLLVYIYIYYYQVISIKICIYPYMYETLIQTILIKYTTF